MSTLLSPQPTSLLHHHHSRLPCHRANGPVELIARNGACHVVLSLSPPSSSWHSSQPDVVVTMALHHGRTLPSRTPCSIYTTPTPCLLYSPRSLPLFAASPPRTPTLPPRQRGSRSERCMSHRVVLITASWHSSQADVIVTMALFPAALHAPCSIYTTPTPCLLYSTRSLPLCCCIATMPFTPSLLPSSSIYSMSIPLLSPSIPCSLHAWALCSSISYLFSSTPTPCLLSSTSTPSLLTPNPCLLSDLPLPHILLPRRPLVNTATATGHANRNGAYHFMLFLRLSNRHLVMAFSALALPKKCFIPGGTTSAMRIS